MSAAAGLARADAAAPADAPALAAGHGVSLSTTAGITAVITGVAAVALLGQVPAQPTGASVLLAGPAAAALGLGAWGLYEARNAVGASMDATAGDPARAGVLAARALTSYHLGMAGVFAGLAIAAAWRVALPLGGVAWAAPLVTALPCLAAAGRAIAWGAVWRRRAGT